jgi:hypothetical protein
MQMTMTTVDFAPAAAATAIHQFRTLGLAGIEGLYRKAEEAQERLEKYMKSADCKAEHVASLREQNYGLMLAADTGAFLAVQDFQARTDPEDPRFDRLAEADDWYEAVQILLSFQAEAAAAK